MKKFTLTLVAALIAVVSFAQTVPSRQITVPGVLNYGSVEKKLTPRPALKKTFAPVTTTKVLGKRNLKRAALTSIDELQDDFVIANDEYELDDGGNLIPSTEVAHSGWAATLEVTGENTIAIYHFSPDATDTDAPITATVDLENSTITIPVGQVLFKNATYGDITLANASGDGDLTGTILEGGIIALNDIWIDELTYQEQKYTWSSYYHKTSIAPPNAVMEYEARTTNNGEYVPQALNVYVAQDEDTYKVTVYGFSIWNLGVEISVESDKTFAVNTNLPVEYGGSKQGLYYVIASTAEGDLSLDLTGTGNDVALTSDSYWTMYSYSRLWRFAQKPFTISLIDGSTFKYPAQEIGELVTPPDGLTTTDWPISANNFYVGDTNTGSYSSTVKLGIVGTDVYIQGMDSFLPDAWVKGTYDAEAKTVTIPVTYMGIHENVTHYLGRYSSDGPTDIVLTYDEEDNTYSSSSSVMIYKGSATTASVAFYNGLLIGTPPTPVTAPDGLITEDMPFKGKLNGATTETEGTVKVGFVDNDVYIQGLFSSVVATGWIKGTISDGKATFPVNQYIGNRSNGTRVYLVGYANSTVGDVVFNYDATNKVFTSTNMVLASGAKNSLSPYSFYSAGLTIGTQPDGINAINADVKSADEGAWYTVNGVRVAAPTQKGLYIHNGKKVVIK